MAAQEAPGEHQRVCADLAEAHQRAAKPLEARSANFMLFDAAERGCDALIRTLLAEGATTEARNAVGNSALEIAAARGRSATVALLIEAGADVDRQNLNGVTALLAAATSRRGRAARVLLDAGADPNLADGKGVTPLIAAAFNGDGRMFTTLLEAGADPAAGRRLGQARDRLCRVARVRRARGGSCLPRGWTRRRHMATN